MYPLLADIYYPIVAQSAYGDVNKRWVLDRTVACSFAKEGRKNKQQIPTGVELIQDSMLIGRARVDLRYSSDTLQHPLTDILITNIRDAQGNSIYNETSGPRNGKTTLFEIKSNEPVVGPFGSSEYFALVIRRSENQGADV
jgi:hypothetical protein